MLLCKNINLTFINDFKTAKPSARVLKRSPANTL